MITTAPRKSAMAKAGNDAADPAVCRNKNKGEIISWASTNDNGRLLRMLVENGNIKPGMTAGQCCKGLVSHIKGLLLQLFPVSLEQRLKVSWHRSGGSGTTDWKGWEVRY